jgi:hypothetical protein
MKDKTIIISGADSYRYGAHLNHQAYADAQGIDYKFHKSENLPNPYFTKCYAILDSFNKGYEYVLWMDDDAFFLDKKWNCTEIFTKYKEDVVVVRGRDKKSGTTYFNNGIMFIKNTPNMRDLFTKIPNTPWKELTKNWLPEWGPLAGNDQPRMIYITQTQYPKSVKVLDYPSFNAHEIEFHKKSQSFMKTNPPIVHVTGQKKESKIQRFIKNTGITLP